MTRERQISLLAARCSREAVVVAVDADRTKGTMEAVEWALKHVVRPRDIFLVLGVFNDQLAKKNSCFPFKLLMDIVTSGERLEFIDHEEVDPIELEEEFERKREQYRSSLQPLYGLCIRNEVRLVLKVAAGFCPARVAMDESQNLNTRWLVLDSHFRKSKVFLKGHVSCNIAVVKEKDFASLMLSNETEPEISPWNPEPKHPVEEDSEGFSIYQLRKKCAPAPHPQSPCCYPMSWRSGFPRAFSHNELEAITNGFADDNISRALDGVVVYQGILQETSVLVKSYPETNKGFRPIVKILSRVYHRNIMNLVGYCSTGASTFLIFDFPCLGNVEMNFQSDELARNLRWRVRWSIALEIGGSLRYLHEECVDGPIVHKSLRSCSVALSHGYSAMLYNFTTAEWLTSDFPPNEDLIAESPNLEGDERLSVDVHDYGKFLLELIVGKSAGKDKSMIDWALPLLENGELCELMDSRVTEIAGDARMVQHMAHAALRCLKIDSDHKLSISEALAIVRGDELATFKQ
ncbi:PREDICTED: inactive kinase [Prunus dulcis]|uniref:PREDICTED: inactive kinase n=1 Tax=Prunus dulcis TaxID=3755 RepID=A0A5E4F049_PRUDU|nr:probable receptor-like protein kinase At1g80640 isoform X2 [Prunus dulcis]VVA21313.1 PREDICTED: inactive kinase [Prunus dulcis]